MTTSSDFPPIASRPRVPHIALLAAALFLATLALYGRAVRFQFIDFDDYRYVVDCLQVQRGLTPSTVRWALTSVFYTNYSPLLLLTELTVSTMFGAGPAGFHGMNVLLHAANVALVFLLMRQLGGKTWIAFIAAAVWGSHPLRVESVAWVSEMKDVLCGFFWLLTVLAYLRYARRRTVASYLLVLLGTLAALSSKPMAVTLPLVLLLLDVYPLRQFERVSPTENRARRFAILFAEKLPLLALSFVWSRLTVVSQLDALQWFPLRVRVANAAIAVVDYLRDTVVPHRLAIFYPHPAILGRPIPTAASIGSLVVLALLSAAASLLAAKRRPAALIGWLWFLGMLVPVLGLVQNNEQARADRSTYLPTLGLLATAVWIISPRTSPTRASRAFWSSAIVLLLVAEATAMERQLSFWRDSRTLFAHTVAVTDNNYLAYGVLANEEIRTGRYEQALVDVNESLNIRPNSVYSLATRGLVLLHLNRNADALGSFVQAIRIDPRNAGLRRNAANLLAELNANKEAEQQFRKAISLNGSEAATHDDYASMLATEGRMNDAMTQWQAALAIDPNFANAHAGLAHYAHLKGDTALAIEHYRLAIRHATPPVKPDWLLDLAWLEATKPAASPDEIDDAVARATAAVPDQSKASPLALDTLGAALARSGQFDRAAESARRGVAAARAAGDTGLANSIQSRMIGYEQGRPYTAGR